MSRLAAEIAGLVEDELRAFNSSGFYAGDRGVTPAAIVEAAGVLPMMADRRVVTVLRAEKMLKPKRRGKAAAEAEPDDEADAEPPTELDVLEAYVRDPAPQTTLVLVAADVDRTPQAVQDAAEDSDDRRMLGAEGGRDGASICATSRARRSSWCKQATAEAGQQIEPAAARLVAERAGTDIARLRGDVERLMLYTAGRPKITLDDARQVVSAERAGRLGGHQRDSAAATPPRRCASWRWRSSPAACRIRSSDSSRGSCGRSWSLGSTAGARGGRGAVPDRSRAEELGRRPRVLLERLVVDCALRRR